MRSRVARHLRSNVVAYLALFVALGGTATATTYVVSSNSQIGPGTVSGAKPPTGDHANIVAASIGNADLSDFAVSVKKIAGNAVNSPRVVDNSLTGADINEASLGTVPSAFDASTLQGHGPADFLQGSGQIQNVNTNVSTGGTDTILTVPGLLTVYAFCGATATDTGQYEFQTGANEGFQIFTDNGGVDPQITEVDANQSAGSSAWATNPAGDRLTFELNGTTHQIWLDMFSQERSNKILRTSWCSYSGHAIVTP